MKFTKKGDGYTMLRFEQGEEIYQGITSFCGDHKIQNAIVHAIGAVCDAELGYYHLDSKSYSWKTFSGDHELVAMTGNITLVDDEPFLHAHVVISGTDFIAHGGHLRKGFAGATCEVILRDLGENNVVSRAMDESIGLRLWNCGG